MRRLTPYEEYLWSLVEDFKAKDEPVPVWLSEARSLLYQMYHLDRILHKTALSKSELEWFAHFGEYKEKAEKYPPELKAYVNKVVPVICEMYATLMKRPEVTFIVPDSSFTREGRRIAREYARKFLQIPWPEVPDTIEVDDHSDN